MTDTNRTKPASYGFDLDFDNLANVKPMAAPGAAPVKAAAKTLPVAKAPVSKPKVAKAPNQGRPAPKPQVLKEREQASDAIAKSLGFSTRESAPAVLKKRRRTHHDEPVDQLSIRGPVRILNRFIDHCENNNLSYWEALEALVPKS